MNLKQEWWIQIIVGSIVWSIFGIGLVWSMLNLGG